MLMNGLFMRWGDRGEAVVGELGEVDQERNTDEITEWIDWSMRMHASQECS